MRFIHHTTNYLYSSMNKNWEKVALLATLFYYFLGIGQGLAQSATTFELANTQEIQNIYSVVFLFDDKQSEYTLPQLLLPSADTLFKLNTQEIPNFANTNSTIWGKFTVRAANANDWFLEIGNPLLDHIEFYQIEGNQPQLLTTAGAMHPFSQRQVRTIHYLFRLFSPTDTVKLKTFYFKIKSDYPMEIPLRASTLQPLLEENHQKDKWYGVYLGLMLSMAIYNFFVYLSIREKLYLYYVVYVASIALFYLHLKGYIFEMLWANYPFLNVYTPTYSNIALTFVVLFAIKFLQTKHYTPKLHKGLFVFLFIVGVSTVLNFADQYVISATISQLFAILICLYLLATGIVAYRAGNRLARYYLLAWSIYLLSVVVLGSAINNAIPINAFTANATLFGTAVEVLLLSFALAARINALKQEKAATQKQLLETLQENDRIIREQNRLLEEKVTQRTNELKLANSELKQLVEELNTTNESLNQNIRTVEAQQKEIYDKNMELNEVIAELNATNEELQSTNDALLQANDVIAIKNANITKSIEYARNIQQAILTKTTDLAKCFQEFFVLYKPKDIVSGDFYWLTQLRQYTFIAVADCTGHGVPGAFMSMIGNNLLKEAIDKREMTSPAEILQFIHIEIRKALAQDDSHTPDGMDIALCRLEPTADQQTKLTFAAAKRPTYIYKPNIEELIELKGNRILIGGLESPNKKPFENQELTLEKGSRLYLLSDGYTDQPNSERTKFGINQFKNLLRAYAPLPLNQQAQYFEETLENFRGYIELRDDVTIVGVQL